MIPRRQWESLGEVVLCSGFPTQLALSGAALLVGLSPQTASGGLSLAFVAAISAADTVALVALMLVLLRRRGESARRLFFGGRSQAREGAVGLLLAPAVLVFISTSIWLLRLLAPVLRTVPENPLEALAASPGNALVLAAVAVVAGGLREEMQRAFLLHRFRTDLGGAGRGVVLTSIAFGLGHILQGWDAVVVTALLGAFWGLLYLVRASITASVVSHATANAAQIAVAYLQRQV
ncbi:MAG TPA: CPBP family intramembrane metalloprotease [Vicinamibacterales bacterium]|nr:CPBP family intramembrane metalloprotease [Vicinamibacterales bacterium]